MLTERQASPRGPVPRDWEVQNLSATTEILDHMRIPINADQRSKRQGSVPYYGANGLQGFIDRALFNEPLILIEDGGNFDDFANTPIAYRISGPSWVNNYAHVVRPASGIDFGYLFFSLEHKDIRYYITGGTGTKLTQAELRSIEIRVPPLPEQRRIAAILDSADEAIEETEALISKLRQAKDGLMHDLLTQGIDEHGHLRDPEANPEQFKDSPLGRIPEEWESP